MPDVPQRRSPLAVTLETEALEARQTADRLESLAGEVGPRLDTVVDQLLPTTWAGAAANAARQRAHAATDELVRAADELRSLAGQLRADAVALREQARWLSTDPAPLATRGSTEPAR